MMGNCMGSSLCKPDCSSQQRNIEGILPKGPYLPCVSMAGRALLAGYPRHIGEHCPVVPKLATHLPQNITAQVVVAAGGIIPWNQAC